MPANDRVARVVLHGRLRKKFGPEYALAASSPARAIQILCILVPEFRQELKKGTYRIIRGGLKAKVAIDARALHMRLPDSGEMHLMPVAGGRSAGTGKIILGIALVAIAFAAPYIAAPLFGAVAPATGVVAGTAIGGGSLAVASTVGGVSVLSSLALFGGAMILGGIASVISNALKPEQQMGSSFLLAGQLNVATQGGAVPVVYGRTRVGSVVISLGYETADYAGSGVSGYIGGVYTNDLGRTPVPGSIGPNGDTGYSGDIGYTGTGRGGGGKGGGGGGGFESPNTLRSNATVRILDLLSEGPIGGLVNGPQSIFFNDTPLMANDGVTWNFHGVSWTLVHGYPDQDPVIGFSAAETVVSENVEVLNGTPIVRTINSTTATSVRITMQIPALYDVNINNGDMRQTDMQYTVEQRASKNGPGGFIGSYETSVNKGLISQKCTSPYEISHRFALAGKDAGANTWDIRITKITANSLRSSLQCTLVWSNMTLITDQPIMYADSAYIALTFDAKAFNGSVPVRTYLIDGRIIQIPANYDPVARTYASSGLGTTGGTWDSFTFINAVCSNPTWILHDMINHDRYGCNIGGTFLETARADLYVISQYADQLVPDGYGSTEPRYAVNVVIAEQTEAYTMIGTMSAAFRGMNYWGAGQVMVTCDMPKNPVKLVNQANVIGGKFNYQGTSLKTRHNLVRASWRDPGNRYSVTPETYELTADIANRGEVAVDIVAWGCTSRGLAHRYAKWQVYTENNQTEVLQYDAGLYHMDLRPGEIFQQQDPTYLGKRWAGRLRSGSTQFVVQLDSVVDVSLSVTLTLSVVMPDSTLYQAALFPSQFSLSADRTYSIVSTTLPLQPNRNAEWILVDNNISQRLFQTIGLANSTDPGQFSINAVNYDPAKFDWVDFNIAFSPRIYSTLPALLLAALTPPSNVTATDYLVGQGTTTIIRLTVSWTPASGDVRVQNYEVQVTNPTFSQNYRADVASIDIDNLVPATYSIAVRSVGRNGQVSAWVNTTDTLVDGLSDPPIAPLGMTAVGGTRRVELAWYAVARRDLNYYEVWRSPSSGGAPTGYTLLALVGGTSMSDSGSPLMLPLTTWWFKVRAVTTTGVVGSFSAQATATTSLLIVDDLADGIINAAKFASSIKPTGLMTGTSVLGLDGDVSFNTTDKQLYKMSGGAWTLLIDLGTISGIVAAAKVAPGLTSAQIVSLTAAQLTGQITTTQITPGAVDTPQLHAGAVTTANLAAGSVTTAALAVGSASNVCWNSCLPQTRDGWGALLSTGTITWGAWTTGSWVPTGLGAGYITTSVNLATNSSQVMVGYWDPTGATSGLDLGIPWLPGQMIEVQAQLMTHRCCARMQVDFYNASGTYISSGYGNRVTGTPVANNSLSSYLLSFLIMAAPAGTARARAAVVAYNDGGADIAAQTTPPYIFWSQFAVGASVPNALVPAPWVQGGVATIAGGMIKAGSIQAASIGAGEITAGKIAANAVTAGTIAANAITAGMISAGAINANEINAGTIKSTMLASTFQLTVAAQIGTALINTAHIGYLQVDTSNIATSAVTNLAAATGNSYPVSSLSMTIVTDGSPVLFWFSSTMTLDTYSQPLGGNYAFAIDGTIFLYGSGGVLKSSGFIVIYTSAGTHTISTDFGYSSGSSPAATIYMGALTVKK